MFKVWRKIELIEIGISVRIVRNYSQIESIERLNGVKIWIKRKSFKE